MRVGGSRSRNNKPGNFTDLSQFRYGLNREFRGQFQTALLVNIDNQNLHIEAKQCGQDLLPPQAAAD